MPTLTNTTELVELVKMNPTRIDLMITNLSNTTVYIQKTGDAENLHLNHSWPIKLNGVFALSGKLCYKGAIHAYVSASSDVRTWES